MHRLRGRPLARHAAGTPDIPVHYIHNIPVDSRERSVRRLTSLGTGHCPVHTGHCPVHTGQSCAPKLAQVWLILAKHHFSTMVQLEKFSST
jgi:hypothetical protein